MRNIVIILILLYVAAKVLDYEPLEKIYDDLFFITDPISIMIGFLIVAALFFYSTKKK